MVRDWHNIIAQCSVHNVTRDGSSSLVYALFELIHMRPKWSCLTLDLTKCETFYLTSLVQPGFPLRWHVWDAPLGRYWLLGVGHRFPFSCRWRAVVRSFCHAVGALVQCYRLSDPRLSLHGLPLIQVFWHIPVVSLELLCYHWTLLAYFRVFKPCYQLAFDSLALRLVVYASCFNSV